MPVASVMTLTACIPKTAAHPEQMCEFLEVLKALVCLDCVPYGTSTTQVWCCLEQQLSLPRHKVLSVGVGSWTQNNVRRGHDQIAAVGRSSASPHGVDCWGL